MQQVLRETLTLVMHNKGMKNLCWTPDHFRVLCAWCNFELRAPLLPASQGAPESHGICVPCALKLGMPVEALQHRNAA